MFEVLEDRRLLSLSDMSLSAAQQAALSSGLQGLATYTTSLAQYGVLGQQLPVVDQSIGSALNINGILQNQLVTPLQTALGSAADSNAVVTALQQLNYSGNGLTVTVASASVSGGEVTPQENELQFNLAFCATRTTTTALDLGSNATTYGLSFPGTANVQLTTRLAFSLAFGLELQSNLAPADAFFIRDTSLTVSASAQLTNANFSGQVGLLDVGVQGGSLALSASVGVAFSPPDVNAANNITLTDLENYTPAQMVTLTPGSASLTGSLPLTATVGSWTTSGSPSINVNSANVFSGAAPTVSFSGNYVPVVDFDRITPASLTSMFQQVSNSLSSIAPSLDAPANSSLPFLNEPVSQLVSLSALATNLANGIPAEVIQGQNSAVASGQFTGAAFSISIGSNSPVSVTVPAATWANLSALVGDVNSALASTSLSGQIEAVADGGKIDLDGVGSNTSQFTVQIGSPSNPAATQLGFASGQQSNPATIQTLVPLLASVMGVPSSSVNPQFNPTTQSLTFALDYQDASQQTLPITFGADVAPLSFDGAANASVSTTATLNATLGVNLGSLQTVLTATSPAPANGQLTADAHFSLTIGSGTPINVTLPAAATQGNQSLSNLVSELNSALASAGLSSAVVAGSMSSMLTLTGLNDNSVQLTAAATDPAVSQLGFSPSQSAITDFVDNVDLLNGSSLTVSMTASANNISGSAAVGSIAAGVNNGNVSLSVSTGVTVSNGPVSLASLLQGGTGQLTPQAASANLTGTLPLSVTGVNLGLTSNPSLSLSLSDPTNPGSVTVTPNGAFQTILNGFSSISTAGVGQALQDMANLLQDPCQGASALLGAFNTPLPIINKSLNDILGTSTALASAATYLNQLSSLPSLESAADNVLQSVVTASAPAPTTGILSNNATFTVGDDGQQPVSVTVPVASTINNASAAQLFLTSQTGTVVTGANAAPANGQLTGDAVFNVSVNGQQPVQVTVTWASTEGNTRAGAARQRRERRTFRCRPGRRCVRWAKRPRGDHANGS